MRRAAAALAAALAGLVAAAVVLEQPGPSPLREVRLQERVVALSFDDGPDPLYTPAVLRLLERTGAHATFFLIGRRALAERGLVQAELAAGDEIGDHTLDHRILIRLTEAGAEREIAAGADALVKAGAPRPRFFRPPLGEHSATIDRLAARNGLRVVLWSIAVERETDHFATARSVSDLLREMRPGAIVLAHDGGPPDRSATLAALPELLDGLRARGYRVVTIGELLALAAAEHPRG